MKYSLKSNYALFSFIAIAFLTVLIFSKCAKDDNTTKVNNVTQNLSEGYKGIITNPNAERLNNKNHFMSADSIESWAARFAANKPLLNSNKLLNTTDIMSNSSSFNSKLIRTIINNENCIGLRIINGMSSDMKIHTMFVGIKPDYSILYVEDPTSISNTSNTLARDTIRRTTGVLGGGEFGISP